ncbi:hypothetical protein ABZ618_29885 [Streptomyces roseolus]|uniref:hypothetical protein n=1 Tax=Streptomyces roseolus TaxID=67358 RepID=UPI0033E368BC
MGRLLRELVIAAGREPYSSDFDPHVEVGIPADLGPGLPVPPPRAIAPRLAHPLSLERI